MLRRGLVLIFLMATAARAAPPEYLIGAYYFSGWWQEEPNKYSVRGQDWRAEFGNRTSKLGQYNDQPTMNREIVAAAEHGVRFFQILWYSAGKSKEPHAEKLNEGVKLFMESPEN